MNNLYIAAFFASLISVGFKGMQHKNVIHNMYGPVALTSFLIALTDIIIIGLVVKSQSLSIAFANGAGAALGMIAAMYVHNRFMQPVTSHKETST